MINTRLITWISTLSTKCLMFILNLKYGSNISEVNTKENLVYKKENDLLEQLEMIYLKDKEMLENSFEKNIFNSSMDTTLTYQNNIDRPSYTDGNKVLCVFKNKMKSLIDKKNYLTDNSIWIKKSSNSEKYGFYKQNIFYFYAIAYQNNIDRPSYTNGNKVVNFIFNRNFYSPNIHKGNMRYS